MVGFTHRVPHREGPTLRGLAATNGDLLPLIDLSNAVGLDPDHQEDDRVPRLLVLSPLQSIESRWTTIVDIVHGVEMSDPETWSTSDTTSPYVKALVQTPRGTAKLLETDALLDSLAAVFQ